MRIGCVATSQVPSSTANSIQVMKTCHALKQVDGEVQLWVPGVEGTAWEKLAGFYGIQTPFEVSWIPENRFWRRYDFSWKAVRRAKQWQADILYTWTPQAAVLALYSKLPVILELHDLPTGKIGPWLFKQFALHPGKKRLLLITEALRDALEKAYNVSLRTPDVQIAPNGTEYERYANLPDAETARKKLGFPDGPTAVYTGHFYAGRGMDLLFNLAKRLPEVNFLWVGGRPEDVESWQRRLADEDVRNVVLTGFVENQQLPLYQAAGDFLLMPYEKSIAGSSGGNSAAICSPMKMFDYLAVGRTILSSDLPVFHEVLNERNAILCPPEDLEAWSKVLSDLLSDEQKQRQLAAQAKNDAQQYTWRARAERALNGWSF